MPRETQSQSRDFEATKNASVDAYTSGTLPKTPIGEEPATRDNKGFFSKLGSIFGNAGKAGSPESLSGSNKFTGVQEGKALEAHPNYPVNEELDRPNKGLEEQGRSQDRMNNLCFWENRNYQNCLNSHDGKQNECKTDFKLLKQCERKFQQ